MHDLVKDIVQELKDRFEDRSILAKFSFLYPSKFVGLKGVPLNECGKSEFRSIVKHFESGVGPMKRALLFKLPGSCSQ